MATVVTLLNWPGWLQIRPWSGPLLAGRAGPCLHEACPVGASARLHLRAVRVRGLPRALLPIDGPDRRVFRVRRHVAAWLICWWPGCEIWPEGTGRAVLGPGHRPLSLAVIWVSWAEASPPMTSFASTGLGLSLYMLECSHGGRPSRPGRACSGALTGFAVLVKLNSGIILAGLLVLALIGADGPRRERWRAGTLAGRGHGGRVRAWPGCPRARALATSPASPGPPPR